MLSCFQAKPRYSSLRDGDEEGQLKLEESPESIRRFVFPRASFASNLAVTVLLAFATIVPWALFLCGKVQLKSDETRVSVSIPASCQTASPGSAVWACQQPTTRREWRTLNGPEQQDYVKAVKCLSTKPSKLRNNGTLYDDFPWVHKHSSDYVHKSAPFLPWHRYYIHLYERSLRDDCNFHGDLPYWDWSLDWNNFRESPVWDAASGLGGNGDPSGAPTVGEGRCVVDGPFASLEVSYFDGEEHAHCLSRGFPEHSELRELGELVKPDAIDGLMDEPDFEKFASEIERRGHTFLSRSVRGDLSKFTGPNDPIFFLHHTNLDRLWSKWQHVNSAERLTAYSGKANGRSDAPARLSDPIDIDGLSRNLMVGDVMSTQSGLFCYQY